MKQEKEVFRQKNTAKKSSKTKIKKPLFYAIGGGVGGTNYVDPQSVNGFNGVSSFPVTYKHVEYEEKLAIIDPHDWRLRTICPQIIFIPNLNDNARNEFLYFKKYYESTFQVKVELPYMYKVLIENFSDNVEETLNKVLSNFSTKGLAKIKNHTLKQCIESDIVFVSDGDIKALLDVWHTLGIDSIFSEIAGTLCLSSRDLYCPPANHATNSQTGSQTNSQTGSQTNSQTGSQTNSQTGSQTNSHANKNNSLTTIDTIDKPAPLLGGISSGGMCWFEGCITETSSADEDQTSLTMIPGLGYLPAIMAPHYDEHSKWSRSLHHWVMETGKIGLGVDSYAALFIDEDSFLVVSDREEAGIWKVSAKSRVYDTCQEKILTGTCGPVSDLFEH